MKSGLLSHRRYVCYVSSARDLQELAKRERERPQERRPRAGVVELARERLERARKRRGRAVVLRAVGGRPSTRAVAAVVERRRVGRRGAVAVDGRAVLNPPAVRLGAADSYFWLLWGGS